MFKYIMNVCVLLRNIYIYIYIYIYFFMSMCLSNIYKKRDCFLMCKIFLWNCMSGIFESPCIRNTNSIMGDKEVSVLINTFHFLEQGCQSLFWDEMRKYFLVLRKDWWIFCVEKLLIPINVVVDIWDVSYRQWKSGNLQIFCFHYH